MLQLDASKHQIVETPVAVHLRRVLRDPGFFTYWHLRARSWNICSWMCKSSGLAKEWDCWEGSPDDCPPHVIQGIMAANTEEAAGRLREWAERLYLSDHHDATKDQEAADTHVASKEWLRLNKARKVGLDPSHPGWAYL